MARKATVLGAVVDLWGDPWDVREERATVHDFPVCLGWPAGAARGKGGSGGPRVVVTPELAAHCEHHRLAPVRLALPIGASALKRVRRLLGHHRRIDAAAWWEARADDLADLTGEAFAERHGKSAGAVAGARHVLFGRRTRPAGWWREATAAAAILAARPRADIADDLSISVGSVGRLRWCLTQMERTT